MRSEYTVNYIFTNDEPQIGQLICINKNLKELGQIFSINGDSIIIYTRDNLYKGIDKKDMTLIEVNIYNRNRGGIVASSGKNFDDYVLEIPKYFLKGLLFTNLKVQKLELNYYFEDDKYLIDFD